MWIFSRAGMFSVVSDGNGGMQIRARNPEHLRKLQRAVHEIAIESLWESVGGDYCCRLLVSRRQWLIVADFLANDATKYGNFKAELEKEHPDDRGLNVWAAATWGRGLRYQEEIRKNNPKLSQ